MNSWKEEVTIVRGCFGSGDGDGDGPAIFAAEGIERRRRWTEDIDMIESR